jgi:hypothetical protein
MLTPVLPEEIQVLQRNKVLDLQGKSSQLWVNSINNEKLDFNNNFRLEQYKTIYNLIHETDVTICNDGESIYCNKNKCFKTIVGNRIGSDSSEGLVYNITINNIKAAIKVMPVLTISDIPKNENEIIIASIVSELVITRKCIFFPIVYKSYECDDIKYSETNNNIIRMAKIHGINITSQDYINYLFEQNIISKEQATAILLCVKKLSKQSINLELNINEYTTKITNNIQRLLEKYSIENISITSETLHPRISGHVIISELANADLGMYLFEHMKFQYVIPDKIWFDIIYGILIGILNLQKNNIIHDDLHQGNILIIIQGNSVLPLIHDFGKSFIIDNPLIEKNWIDTDKVFLRQKDIIRILEAIKNQCFINDLNNYMFVPMTPIFLKFFNNFYNFVTTIKDINEHYIENIITYFIEHQDDYHKHKTHKPRFNHTVKNIISRSKKK